MKLTDAQREMVEQHEWVAHVALAEIVNTRRDHREYLGAAYLALCEAACCYEPGGSATFRTYAWLRVRYGVLDAMRDTRGRPGSLKHAAIHVGLEVTRGDREESVEWARAVGIDGPEHEVLARLELEEVLEWISELAPRQRAAMTVVLDEANGAPWVSDARLDSIRGYARRRLRALRPEGASA